ncbi:MAG: hypothetical protein KGO48_16005, partial [Alphaproteobacteria bacterium]|nr:hypothetical protein [Alphaproteobacteria bacterium]
GIRGISPADPESRAQTAAFGPTGDPSRPSMFFMQTQHLIASGNLGSRNWRAAGLWPGSGENRAEMLFSSGCARNRLPETQNVGGSVK